MATRTTWDFDTLSPALKRFLPAIDAGVDLAFDAMIPRAETYMRDNAPWTDRTGNARNGLKAEHQKQEMRWHQLTLSHSVPYGIWLEVRWSGRYAILNPTLEKIGPELMRTATEAANRAIQLVGEG